MMKLVDIFTEICLLGQEVIEILSYIHTDITVYCIIDKIVSLLVLQINSIRILSMAFLINVFDFLGTL